MCVPRTLVARRALQAPKHVRPRSFPEHMHVNVQLHMSYTVNMYNSSCVDVLRAVALVCVPLVSIHLSSTEACTGHVCVCVCVCVCVAAVQHVVNKCRNVKPLGTVRTRFAGMQADSNAPHFRTCCASPYTSPLLSSQVQPRPTLSLSRTTSNLSSA